MSYSYRSDKLKLKLCSKIYRSQLDGGGKLCVLAENVSKGGDAHLGRQLLIEKSAQMKITWSIQLRSVENSNQTF